jgi:hypothetical protein
MGDLEFPSPFEPSDEINEELSFDQNGVEGRERSLNSFSSTNGDINALKFAARDIRSLSLAGERDTDEVINFLSKEIGDQGFESHLNQDQLQDALKDLQLENSINYNFSNGDSASKSTDLSSSTNTSLSNSEQSEAFNTSNITFPPISTPLPPPLNTGDIPEQSPFEMMSPFEPSEFPEAAKPPKKLSLGDAPYSLDDFIDSSPFEPTSYVSPSSNSSATNISSVTQSGGQTQIFSSTNTAANYSMNEQPISPSNSYPGMPFPNNNFTNAQPSSSPPISVISVGPTTRRFSVLKELAPLSSSPPISVKQNPKSAPSSPRNEISKVEEPNLKPAGRSNSLNSTYGSSPVTNSGSIPKKESGGNLSPLHEYREELMETIVVDQNQGRKGAWVIHKPVTKDYQLGSHRKSTAVSTTTVAQLNAAASQNRMQSVKFTEPLKDNSAEKSKWQSVEKHETPKIGKEGVRKQRKSMLTRSSSASSLPRNSISKDSDGASFSNSNADKPVLRKNSKTEPTSPLQISKSESVIQDPTSNGLTAALSEASLIGSPTSDNNTNNNNNDTEEKTKPRRKSLIGKLTRTLSSTFKPLISAGKEKDTSSPTSPVNSGNSSLSSSPTSTIKLSAPPANEKRKKRSASDARNKKPILPVANDRDRSQTVVTFNDMMQRNQGNGPYSANGIFGVPLDILYQQNDGVPDLINVCCGYLVQKALNLEGLFRISPTLTEVNRWKTDLTFESMNKLNDIDNPHLVASLLKQFFLDLPDPLFTDELFKQFQDATDIENVTLRKIKLEELLSKLPEANYTVLQALVTFLRKVAAHSHENKMDARNLGLVLSPSVLRRKSAVFDVADLSKAKQHWMIIHDLIVHHDVIRDTPPRDYLPVD